MNLQRMIALFMDYCLSKQLRPKNIQIYICSIGIKKDKCAQHELPQLIIRNLQMSELVKVL